MGTEFLIDQGLVNLAYLVASILFIIGIKGLTHPRTAVRGNFLGGMGMLLAALATVMAKGLDFKIIIHKIHAARMLAKGYTIYGQDSTAHELPPSGSR